MVFSKVNLVAAAILTLLLCACTNHNDFPQETTAPSSGTQPSVEEKSSQIISSSLATVESDGANLTQEAIYVSLSEKINRDHFTYLKEIEITPIIVSITNGETAEECAVPPMKMAQSLNPYNFMPDSKNILPFQFRNHQVMLQYGAGGMSITYHLLSKLSGDTTPIYLGNNDKYPYVLSNDYIVTYQSSGPSIMLYNLDGTLAPIQLHFDYGNLIVKYPPHAKGLENKLINMIYDEVGEQYVTLCEFTQYDADGYVNPYYGLVLFSQYGWETQRFSFDIEALGELLDNDLFMLEQNKLLLFNGSGGDTLVDLTSGVAERLNDERKQELVKKYPQITKCQKRDTAQWHLIPSTAPCPVTVEYHPDGTKIFAQDADKTLLTTLPADQELAYYTWDETLDNIAYLVFYTKQPELVP